MGNPSRFGVEKPSEGLIVNVDHGCHLASMKAQSICSLPLIPGLTASSLLNVLAKQNRDVL
jgi:hypothetical protein